MLRNKVSISSLFYLRPAILLFIMYSGNSDSSLLSKSFSERSSTHKNVIPEKMAAKIQ